MKRVSLATYPDDLSAREAEVCRDAKSVNVERGVRFIGVLSPFPPKPKGRMHWQRYERLRARHDRAGIKAFES